MSIQLSRRSLLRGAGACLALPFLEAMLPRSARAAAAALAKPPLRMGIFTVTGGTVLESWKPVEGALGELPSILRPLEFARRDMLLVSGLSHHGKSEGNLNAHQQCASVHLTAASVVKNQDGKIVASISVDQAAAQVAGKETFLPSLEIGLGRGETKYSFAGSDAPVPYESNPRLVFDRMFRGRQPALPPWAGRGRARVAAAAARPAGGGESLEKSVLDLVLEEAKSLSRKLGSGDRARLDEYMESVRAAELRVSQLGDRQANDVRELAGGVAGGTAAPGGLILSSAPDGDIWKNQQPMMRDPERHADYIRLMSDLMVLAFQTDTTRVCTFACGSDEAMFPGVVTVGYERHCHTLEHQGNAAKVEQADPISREACRQIHAWYTTLFAEMVRKMKTIDDGGVSLLDNTMLLYTSYMADGGHGRSDYPALLVGNAQKTLRTGRHVACERGTPVANLYVEMLQRMGAKVDEFGESKTSPKAKYDGRIPGLA